MSSASPAELTPVMDPQADALGALESQASDYSADERATIGQCLSEVLDCMKRAQSVWKDYADNPSESDVGFTAVMRIGNERSRELHRVHLELREIAKRITDVSGIRFRDTIGFSTQIDIVNAYAELGEGETGADRAKAALATMGERIARLEGVKNHFR